MSVKVMSQVWERDDLDPYEKLVLLSLADHANDEGICYPSIGRLEKRTGMKERGLQNVIKRLVEKGFLHREMNAGRKGSNLYQVTEPPAPDAPRIECTPAPDAPNPRIECASTPAPDAPEPSKNRQGTVNIVRFSEFWTNWPNKNAKARAEAAWKKLSNADRRVAADSAAAWFSRWRTQNPQASPILPASYLNGRRWEDEAPSDTQSNSKIKRYQKIGR